jgi:hypothetical protein
MNNPTPTNKTIDSILLKAFDEGYRRSQQIDGLADDRYIAHQETTVDKAKLALLTYIKEEVIGEDEEDDLNPFGMMARSTGRNTLREDQRERLEHG